MRIQRTGSDRDVHDESSFRNGETNATDLIAGPRRHGRGQARASAIGVAVIVAVVDEGVHLKAFTRDGPG